MRQSSAMTFLKSNSQQLSSKNTTDRPNAIFKLPRRELTARIAGERAILSHLLDRQDMLH